MSSRIIVILWLCLSTNTGFAQEAIQKISFNSLSELVKLKSPEAKLIGQDFELEKSVRNIALRWSNPELNFSRENVDNGTLEQNENMIYLSKSLSLPWIYLKNRQSWSSRIQSAEYLKLEQLGEFFAEVKSGYMEISLLQTQEKSFKDLKQIVENASNIVKNQFREGAVSGLNQQLIQMVSLNLEGKILQLSQDIKIKLDDWKTKVGIDKNREVELITTISFKLVDITVATQSIEDLQNYPGIKSRNLKGQSLQKQVSLERWKVIPELNFYGGYKTINPNFKGYMFGVSFALPVLNFNRAQVQNKQIELNRQNYNIDIYKTKLHRKFDRGLNLISGYQETLGKMAANFNQKNTIENILTAYQEGWISLTEMLNSFQIVLASSQQYHQQLILFYKTVFELEAITGKQLVEFK